MPVTAADLREIHDIGSKTREWLVAGESIPALARARIVMCGVSRCRSGFHFVRHAWEHSQLLLALGPGGACLIDDDWRALAPGEGYLTPAGVTHAYRCLPDRTWWHVWAILREPEEGDRRITAERPVIIPGDGRPLHDAVLNLHRETLGAGDPTLVRQWSDLVVAMVNRHLAPVQTDQRLWRLWEEIDADLSQPWTLGDLARRADLGQEQLRRLCRRQLDASPMQHLTRLRMRRAAALLASGDRSIGQVAEAVGYANAFAFSTAFRRHHGVPPSYRRICVRDGIR